MAILSWFSAPFLARMARDGMVKHQEEEAKKAAANPAPAETEMKVNDIETNKEAEGANTLKWRRFRFK